MEYILEMNEARQIVLPEALVNELHLTSGAHFSARLDAGRMVIENIPFSRLEQAQSLERTIDALK